MIKGKYGYVIVFCFLILLTSCFSNNEKSNDASDVVASSSVAPSSSKAEDYTKIVKQFQTITEDLLKICRFPIILPTYLPQPDVGLQWSISPEIKSNTFSVEIDQKSEGVPGAMYYGTLSENISKPSEQQEAKQFVKVHFKTINLPNGITGKEYVLDPNVVGGTAITWESGNWVFFVSGCSGNSYGSAISFAEQVINEINNIGQTLPGSQGEFYLIFTSNKPTIEIYWVTVNGVWYELDWQGNPIEAIKVLQSMVNVDNNSTYAG
ncbi:MAG: hypothetical protein P4L49_07380 [Desulfosporosinus sp.]|nr:hypothetical protein [Desulfosporosinus sp.]